MKKVLFSLLSLILLCSHDLFLKSDNYFPASNQNHTLYLINGTFNKSENIITRDRIINSKITGQDFQFIPSDDDWYDNDKITYLKFKTGTEGTYVAGVSTLERSIKLSSDEFDKYLEHDGVLNILNKRKEQNLLKDTICEIYSKHVKAVFQISGELSEHYKEIFGYPVEFVPLRNPYGVSLNENLEFQLLKEGKPLANQLVYAGFSNSLIQNEHDGHSHSEIKIRTDDRGQFSVKIDHQGEWYIRTIYMIESYDEEVDYESNWATITFKIK